MHAFTKYTRLLFFIALIAMIVCPHSLAQLVPNLGGQRAGISAYQFLKIGAGARGVALGETFVAIANDASALYWNPAGLSQFTGTEVMFAHTEYVIDIKHEFFGGEYDAIGAAVTSLHMEDMEVTTETQPLGTGRYFSFGDLAVALSYSRKMTDQFSFGLTGRYVEETLDVLKMRGFMVDLGTYYWTGLGTARFAVVVSNFGGNVSPSGEVTHGDGSRDTSFQSFSPPTLFKIGFAIEPVEMENQRLTTSIELHHPNDNAENVHLGVEYAWRETFFLRAGVRRTIGQAFLGRDDQNAGDISLGAGAATTMSIAHISFDYAYAHLNLLGSVHRFSVGMSF